MLFPSKSKYLQSTILVFILLLCFGIYLPHLSRTVTYDEAYTYIQYAQSPLTALFAYTTPNNHLLHSFLVWISTSLIGDSLIAIRLPAFAMAVLSIAYAGRIGIRLQGWQSGLFAMVILASMPLFAEYAINARGYSLSILLTLVIFEQIYFGGIWVSRAKGRLLLVTTIVLIMTLPTMVLLVLILNIWVLIKYYRIGRLRVALLYILPMVFGSLIGSVFYSFGFINQQTREFVASLGLNTSLDLFHSFTAQLSFGYFMPIVYFGGICGIVLGYRRQKTYLNFMLLTLVTIGLLAFLQEQITHHVLFARSYIFLLPFISLLIGMGLSSLVNHVPLFYMPMTLALVGLILSLSAINFQRLSTPTTVDALNTAIESHKQEGDVFLMGCCLDFPIYYIYYRGAPVAPENVNRIILIPTEFDPINKLKKQYELPDSLSCIPSMWDEFEVNICTR